MLDRLTCISSNEITPAVGDAGLVAEQMTPLLEDREAWRRGSESNSINFSCEDCSPERFTYALTLTVTSTERPIGHSTVCSTQTHRRPQLTSLLWDSRLGSPL